MLSAMYKDIPRPLLDLVEPVVRAHGLELVDAGLGRGPTRSLLRVVVDTPDGDGRVPLDACAAVSRELGSHLEAQDAVAGAYTLEVCSPGVDRTLGREIDFARAVGRKIELHTRVPLAGRRNFRGELIGFDGACAQLRGDDGVHEVPFAAIERAKSLYPFPSPQKPKR